MKQSLKKIKLVVVGNLQSVHLKKYCAYFSRQKKYEIHFITPYPAKFPGIIVHSLSPTKSLPRFVAYLINAYRVRKMIRKIKPDLVHAFDMVACGIWTYLSGYHPYIASSWASDVFEIQMFNPVQRYLIKQSLKSADFWVLQAVAIYRRILNLGIPKKPYQKIQFGIDLKKFKPAEKTKSSIDRPQIIFYPRNIEPIYNLDMVIKAFYKVNLIKPKTNLILIDYSNNPTYYRKIRTLITDLKLENKVNLIKKIPNEKMPSYYHQADIVLSVPRSDGVSIVMLEAMACGKKIVVSRLPYIKEWQKGDNLWVAKVGDPADTAEKILAALNCLKANEERIKRLNRKIVEENAEINANFLLLDNYYCQALSKLA